jgi:hypothetical protein
MQTGQTIFGFCSSCLVFGLTEYRKNTERMMKRMTC